MSCSVGVSGICRVAVACLTITSVSSISTLTPVVSIPCHIDSRCALESFNTTLRDVDVLYEASEETINGTLKQDVILDTNGTCVTMAYIFTGNDNIKNENAEKVFYPLEDVHKKLVPTFGSQSRCQWFNAALRLYHGSCKKFTYGKDSYFAGQTKMDCKKQDFRAKLKHRVLNRDPKCLHLLGGIKINPLITWLEMKMADKSYPIVNIRGHSVYISWGKATEFGCDDPSINTKGTIGYKLLYKKMELVKGTKTIKDFTPIKIDIKNNDLKHVRCIDWNVMLELNMGFNFDRDRKGKFWTQANPIKFKTIVKKEKYNLKVTAIKNTTMMIIQAKKGTNTECLSNKVDIEVVKKDKGNVKSPKLLFDKSTSIQFDGKVGYVDLRKFNNEKCEDTFLTVTIKDITDEAVITDIYCNYPTVKEMSKKIPRRLLVTPQHFQGCSNLHFNIECTNEDNVVTNLKVCSNCSFEIPNIDNNICKAKAYLNEDQDDATCGPQWVNIIGTDLTNKTIQQESISTYILVGLGGLLVIVLASIVIGKQKKKKQVHTSRKGKREENERNHFIINKNEDNISEKLNFMVNNQVGEIIAEFNTLQSFANQNINLKTEIALLDENRLRNRYSDVLPYDTNIVTLKMKQGNPPSTYINASKIEFPGICQKFLSVQAPKMNMYSSFWQMIEEQNIKLIVMITGLEEMGRVKADKYWPDANNTILEFDYGLTVRFVNESNCGTFCHRSFAVKNGRGMERKVQHLQTERWKDKAAPSSTKILLDLLYKSEELMRPMSTPLSPPPILVHCSAGVGRTGTYIGLFKLVNDFHNDNVEELNFYQTVLAMREQRMKMVQKPLQYHYMIKCLSDYIASKVRENVMD